MSIVTRKIELIPDIENLTHEESNQRCYKLLYNIDKKLYKLANLLVCQLFGLDNLLSLMRLQNDEYVKCQSKLVSKSISKETQKDIKERMKEIDKELLARKAEIAPKSPLTFAYRVQLKIAIMPKTFRLIYLILSNRTFLSTLTKQRKNN